MKSILIDCTTARFLLKVVKRYEASSAEDILRAASAQIALEIALK